MNTCCQISSPPPSIAPASGPFSFLQRLINTAGLASVDLTDTIFAGLPSQAELPPETPVPLLPLSERPDHTRLVSYRLL